jgi:hypothetical protein
VFRCSVDLLLSKCILSESEFQWRKKCKQNQKDYSKCVTCVFFYFYKNNAKWNILVNLVRNIYTHKINWWRKQDVIINIEEEKKNVSKPSSVISVVLNKQQTNTGIQVCHQQSFLCVLSSLLQVTVTITEQHKITKKVNHHDLLAISGRSHSNRLVEQFIAQNSCIHHIASHLNYQFDYV